MPAPTEKQPDQKRIVASLALECQVPISEMTTLYERERAKIAVGAHITKFLHIFATRKVLEIMQQRELDKHTAIPPKPALLAV
jgi:hypothetical protein